MTSATPAITISSLSTPADVAAFALINQEWITRLFSLTDEDRKILNDPVAQIVDPGGDVLLARTADGESVGCVALLPQGDGIFELAKMGVTPRAQGAGIGRRLIDAAIMRASELHARHIFLGTNSSLGPAIRLYEAAGFKRITRAELPVEDYYARADILMKLSLET